MAEVDAELLERIVRWCAEAGRQAGSDEIRRALAPLGWDDLLAVRALLADPPPARPLGPHALADIARGAPPEVAAERERGGRYRSEREEDGDRPAPAAAPATPRPRPRKAQKSRRAGPVIHRARDRSPPPPASAPQLPRVDDLRRPEGRAVLERLLRRHGARRSALAVALAAGWRRDDGSPPGEGDLASLLEHHGLSRAFAHRERDELLHALRAAGGVRGAAAASLALDPAGLQAALERLGATAEAERIRGERRAELRGRATLAERVRLVLGEEERLRDLDVLDEFAADLRARLPEHLRALRAGRTPLRAALAASLSLDAASAEALAERFGLDLGPRAEPRERGARGRGPGRKRTSRPTPGRGRPSPGRGRPSRRPRGGR